MEVIYGLLPFIIVIGLAMVAVLFWAVKSGQFDDLEGPAERILMDEDDPLLPRKIEKKKQKDQEKD
jgi:cbb3-type cytochrome oxidase maturation protein